MILKLGLGLGLALAGFGATNGALDELVARKWAQEKVQPASLCPDGVFVRRAFLDIIGTLPTAEEASAFLADNAGGKRGVLIDRLLDREEFADYWAMKWSDLLRVKAEFPINLWPNAAQGYYHWIHDAIRRNQPYDQFARELLTASGSNFRDPPANFYRAMQSREPESIARTVALTFMGVRAEKWPAARLAGMAAFFSQIEYKHSQEWKEEIVYFDPSKKLAANPIYPDGTPAHLAVGQDPRETFAAWLTAPKNPWFARAMANRVWFWLLGRGIVEAADDIGDDNPPENPELLAYLTQELTASHYDVKHLFRLILNSNAYQLSAQGNPDHFAAYKVRRLDAEVLIDAICQVTGTTESYTSSIPEPYTFMPGEQRAISLPDGSIGSSFLELFGRPGRDTGLESERNNRMTDAQRLHLLNSSHIQRKIQQSPKLQALMKNITDPQQLVTQIYLTVLSRRPTEEEWTAMQAHAKSNAPKGQAAVVDLVWSLINSTEFLYRH